MSGRPATHGTTPRSFTGRRPRTLSRGPPSREGRDEGRVYDEGSAHSADKVSCTPQVRFTSGRHDRDRPETGADRVHSRHWGMDTGGSHGDWDPRLGHHRSTTEATPLPAPKVDLGSVLPTVGRACRGRDRGPYGGRGPRGHDRRRTYYDSRVRDVSGLSWWAGSVRGN